MDVVSVLIVSLISDRRLPDQADPESGIFAEFSVMKYLCTMMSLVRDGGVTEKLPTKYRYTAS
jgi:hypothetical protein